MIHKPVLLKEILEYLGPKPNENFIDCTTGEGGHALAIIERILPEGRVLGIDRDPGLIQQLKVKGQKSKVKNNIVLVSDSYVNLKDIVERLKFGPVHGILFDLGMSSWHLEESGRGFSFLRDEPLDMRYDSRIQNRLTAEKIVNEYPQEGLEKILREYGQERFSRRIAQEIFKERGTKPIKTTFQLLAAIKRAIPAKNRHKKIHFATRTFQSLRITVNDELNNLKKALPQAINVLGPGGRIVTISFHSLEDRIVKNFFRDLSPEKLKILTKKPITPSGEEIKTNPRSRSAKLRAAIRI
jgi:16S rRNA (cytosine1402-N4)-methyltransferase